MSTKRVTAESSLSSQPSESLVTESETSTLSQGDPSTSADQETADSSQAQQAEESPVTGVEGPRPPVAVTGRPLSPRQRRAQQHIQREATSRPALTPAPRQPHEESHTGSALLIVVLALALAVLIFRRIYVAQEYKFDYEL